MTRTASFSHQAVFRTGIAISAVAWGYCIWAVSLNWNKPHIVAIRTELMKSAEFKPPVGFNYVKGLLK